MTPDAAGCVFRPDPAATSLSAMSQFRTFVSSATGTHLPDYAALQAYALAQPERFWTLWLDWSGMVVSGNAAPAVVGTDVETATFFPNLRLNYAENLLAGDPNAWAVASYDEKGLTSRLRRVELRDRVCSAAALLAKLGVGPGDRVVGMVRNTTESVIACLGCAALGAVWSSVAPDFGTDAILARFQQLAPVMLVVHTSTWFQGTKRDLHERVQEVVAGLGSLRALLVLDPDSISPSVAIPCVALDAMSLPEQQSFEHFPFNTPLFTLFSSGTTGVPKCIVHGAGGTLLEHLKELRLHCGLGPGDRLLFHTSAGWMMWNWQLSALAAGCEIVLYDGSVSAPEPDALLRLVDEGGITVFGTSPAYLQFLQDSAIEPNERFRFESLRGILSTGSVLPDSAYSWVDERFKHLPLQSISGGTDIIGCFVLGNPELPVYEGESQCVSLGYDVRVIVDGTPSRIGTGELVCCSPFPSRPLGLYGDTDGQRFHEAYFAQNAGMWTHGDLLELAARGTARVRGRTDGTLNVRGVRIGPAEVCSVVLQLPAVRQAMAIEQRAPREPGGSRMVLLVVLHDGIIIDRPLRLRMKRELSTRASPNHVPAVIAQVGELPTTYSGKLSERAARDAANGLDAGNAVALRNPGSLDAIREHPDLRP